MRKLVCLLVVLVIGLTAQVAGAHYLSHPDPRDTEGGFDVERVRLRIDGENLVGKVLTYDDWPCCWELSVEFDSRGDDTLDYYLYIEWDGGSGGIVAAELRRRNGRVVEDSIRVRADWEQGELRFRFPETRLNATKDVRWRMIAGSWLEGDDWEDLAPNSGWFDH